MTTEERFLAKVELGECWIWVASTRNGYGAFWNGSSMAYAHRWAYEQYVEPIPEGMQIDHICHNKLCVNPDHLEPVAPKENSVRYSLTVTACKRGHPFNEENTYYYRPGHRRCRTCRREALRRWYAANAEAHARAAHS